MEAYNYLREREKRLIARLKTLGYPIGITLSVLAQISQLRAELARELHLERI